MIVNLIGWSLIHSLWQGALIALALGGILWATRRSTPRVRHLSCVVALLCIMVLPVATALRHAQGSSAASPASSTVDDAVVRGAGVVTNQTPEPQFAQGTRFQRVSSVVTRIALPSVNVEAWLPWLVGLWVFGVLLFSIRSVVGLIWTRNLVKLGTSAAGAVIERRAAELGRVLRVRSAFRVLISTRARVPMVIGWLRPLILLPASLLVGLTPSQLDAILAHELAHIRRFDYAINLIQTIVETLFFYHPAVWWIGARIREESEHACDDLAVVICGGDRVFYSEVLLTVEQWRGARIGLALSVTGGSLVKRIERLLDGENPHVELGTRWFAGVFTVLTAVFAAGGVARSAGENEVPIAAIAQDTTGARPSSVTRYEGSGSLDQRWSWAEQRANRNRFYWIGYAIDGDARRTEQFYFDDQVQARSGESWMSGRLRYQDGTTRMQFSGIALGSLVGNRPNHRLAIFLGVEDGPGGGRITRVHLSNFGIPVHFGGQPLFWLGDVADAQSIARLTALVPRARNEDLGVTLIAMVGVHTDARAMLPPLRAWLTDPNLASEVRREAARGIGTLALPQALALLSNRARNDRDPNVRRVSVEVLGHSPLAAATDTLMVFVRLDLLQLRRQAVSALGHRKEASVVPFLDEIVRANLDELRGTALQSLAIMENGMGLEPVIGYARRANPILRREAIFALAHASAPPSANVLLELVERDPDLAIQVTAVQSLGAVHDHANALIALDRVARTHPNAIIQVMAVKGLGSYFDGEEGGRLLLKLAESHPNPMLQREAVHALEHYHDYPVFESVAAIGRSHPDESVRRQAVETYGLNAPKGTAASYLQAIASENTSSIGIKLHALELLADLDDDAGVPALRELARSADAAVRDRAAQLLTRR
jgi:beta-lactamase regulating signal transducer with metallopeptidase domain/HEAT repeat protein